MKYRILALLLAIPLLGMAQQPGAYEIVWRRLVHEAQALADQGERESDAIVHFRTCAETVRVLGSVNPRGSE